MRRSRKRFKRPKRPYSVVELQEGKELQAKYGLRRKKEIWIARGIIRSFRQRARELIAARNPAEEKVLLDKLARMGLLPPGAALDDVLGLTIEGLLSRRLQTVVASKGLVKTPKQARQAIVHGHVRIGSRKIVFPSYLVLAAEEGQITSSFRPPEPPAKKPEEGAV